MVCFVGCVNIGGSGAANVVAMVVGVDACLCQPMHFMAWGQRLNGKIAAVAGENGELMSPNSIAFTPSGEMLVSDSATPGQGVVLLFPGLVREKGSSGTRCSCVQVDLSRYGTVS